MKCKHLQKRTILSEIAKNLSSADFTNEARLLSGKAEIGKFA
jgi:hypothetical protein